MRVAFLALIFSFSALLSSAAQYATSTSPQALQLLQQALTALSGSITTNDVTLSGTAHYIAGSDDETGTSTLKAIATGAGRIDLNLPSGPRSEVRTVTAGSPAGTWSGPDRASHSIASHNLLTEPAWFFPSFLVAHGVAPSGYAATYIGHETLNGQTVEHVTISHASVVQITLGATTLDHLSQTDLFLDSTTFLPAAIAFNIHPDNNALLDIPIHVRFSDYRSVNGTKVPFHVEKYLNNGLILDLQFQSAAINSGLSLTTFAAQ
jgi:hypothetical protein